MTCRVQTQGLKVCRELCGRLILLFLSFSFHNSFTLTFQKPEGERSSRGGREGQREGEGKEGEREEGVTHVEGREGLT